MKQLVDIKKLPKNTNYEWKVTFNGKWGGDKRCNNCQFNSGSSSAILLIYKPYTAQLMTSPLNRDQIAIILSVSTSTSTAICNHGICQSSENHQTCSQDCPNDLPGCDVFPAESCQSGTQFHANPGIDTKRWQTPKPGSDGYQASYQDYYVLVGYAVILEAVVTANDRSTLKLPEIDFIWNVKPLVNRSGDYNRNGQKGAVAEMFGWTHKDLEQECEFLSKAGYLGVKVFPVHEQLMSTQPMKNAINPWYSSLY